jgi:RNA-directed DNA polymerase
MMMPTRARSWKRRRQPRHIWTPPRQCSTPPNIYVRSERAGHRVMANVVRFIERQLRLKVNQAKSAVARPEDRHFVGFSLRRNPEDGTIEVFLSKRSKERIDARIRELTPRAWGQSLRGCIAALNTYLRGWLNFFGTSCTDAVVRTLHTLDAHIRRRLRAVLLRQWKRKRFIVRRLIRLGAQATTAWRRAYQGKKSLWALSHCGPVDYALDKMYFADHGLFSLEHQYRDMHHVMAPAQLTLALA